MSLFNLESFEITRLVDLYRGKKLEDLYGSSQRVCNEMGEFLEIFRSENKIPPFISFLKAKAKLVSNLKTVPSIGEVIEKQLLRRGIKNLYDLKHHLKYKDFAGKIINFINNKDYQALHDWKYVRDLDLIFCFEPKDLLFLDIETLGLFDDSIILIGLGYFEKNSFSIHQLFARTLEEEIALCEHLKTKILPNFKSLITYNGKSFDVPFLANRFMYFFNENPMISTENNFYSKYNSKYYHIDLYRNCKRNYRGLFDNYSLTAMEQHLLNWKRENELPSNLVGLCYKKYLSDPERYIGLVKEIIDHNYYDIYSMPLLLQKLLDL